MGDNAKLDINNFPTLLAVDSNGNIKLVEIDSIAEGVIFISTEHHKIHEGEHFFFQDSVLLNSAETQDYLITIPNSSKRAHIIFALDGSAITQFQLFEGSDKNGTTSQIIVNNDRNSSKTPIVTIHKGTSGGTVDGTVIKTYKSGAAQGSSRTGAVTRNDDELILKNNTKYILRITSGTADNLINAKILWYEN